jgi:hypothetical protein
MRKISGKMAGGGSRRFSRIGVESGELLGFVDLLPKSSFTRRLLNDATFSLLSIAV